MSQPSSDNLPMEEEAVCLDEDTMECDAGPVSSLTAKEYIIAFGPDRHQLVIDKFASMTATEQCELVREIDQLEHLENGAVAVSKEKRGQMEEDLKNRRLLHSVYSKNLAVEATVVKSKMSLPPLSTNIADFDDDSSLRWHEWLERDGFYSLNPAFPLSGRTEFEISLDADATCIHSPTLAVVKQTMQVHCAPNYEKFSKKIKHKYKGILLHSKVNIEIGQIGLRWKVFAVFTDFERGSKCASAVIRAFYVKMIEGVAKSSQAGRTGFEKHTEEFLLRGMSRDQMAPLEPSTLLKIMESLQDFEFNRRRANVVFSFQYCGQKDGLRDSTDLSNYINTIESTFDINGICDPSEVKYKDVLFIQDLALVINPKHNAKNPLMVSWAPQFLHSLSCLEQSPLATMYHTNERYPLANGSEFVPEKARCDIYPNLGIGSLQSAMIGLSDTTASIYEVKAYFSGSAYWRRHQPYDSTSYCASVLPYEILLMGSSVPVLERMKIVKDSEDRKKAFLKNNPETAKIDAALAKLDGMSYGARLEISFLNLSKYELIYKFKDLMQLGNDIIDTHCSLSSMYMDRNIPLETLRLSPIQVVTSQSLVQLVSFQARLLNHMYKSIFAAAAEVDGSKLESDLVNALVILEDMQHFLWSGSVRDLLHPTLFKRLNIVDNLFRYNRFYLPSELLAYDHLHPERTRTTLPQLKTRLTQTVLDCEDIDGDEEGIPLAPLSTHLAVSRRVFYRAFGGKQYENVMSACSSLSATAQLLMSTTSSFFAPLYNSKSMVIACNILNAMFTELFNHIGIHVDHQANFFEAMCEPNTISHPRIIKASRSSMDIDSLLEVIFCMSPAVLRSVVVSDFYELWRHALRIIQELNDQWKWSSFASFRDKDPDSVMVLPTITRADILKQMLILCHQYELKWFPVIGTDSLVVKRNVDQRFFVARIRIPFETTVLPIRGMVNGKPLHHPVDMSFVYMVARYVAKKEGGPECRINEMVGHIMYHYTKILGDKKKLPNPRYSNVTKESLTQCCLFEDLNFTTVSRNRIYNIHERLIEERD